MQCGAQLRAKKGKVSFDFPPILWYLGEHFAGDQRPTTAESNPRGQCKTIPVEATLQRRAGVAMVFTSYNIRIDDSAA